MKTHLSETRVKIDKTNVTEMKNSNQGKGKDGIKNIWICIKIRLFLNLKKITFIYTLANQTFYMSCHL